MKSETKSQNFPSPDFERQPRVTIFLMPDGTIKAVAPDKIAFTVTIPCEIPEEIIKSLRSQQTVAQWEKEQEIKRHKEIENRQRLEDDYKEKNSDKIALRRRNIQRQIYLDTLNNHGPKLAAKVVPGLAGTRKRYNKNAKVVY